jgi:hypothetical protein
MRDKKNRNMAKKNIGEREAKGAQVGLWRVA